MASAANANNVQSFEPATNSTDDANYDDLETNARTAAREPLEFNMALVLAIGKLLKAPMFFYSYMS